MASCALESSTKNWLEDVRAFLFHNLDMLETYADRDKAAGESRFIALINKREKHLCRSIHRAQSAVKAVCYSPDGSKLARAEGREVVVCDACTGFVQKTLRGDKHINCFAFSTDGKILAAGDGTYFEAGFVRLYDTVTGDVKSTLTGHTTQ
jgi:WD40 repeat protein